MATITLIQPMSKITRTSAPVAIEVDATITQNHDSETEVTEHPVEEGADITDHARLRPVTFTMEGLISNTPLNRSQTRRIIETQGVTVESASTADFPSGAPGYAEEAYQKLKTLEAARQLLTIVTELHTYNNMMITSLRIPRDAKTGDSLHFSASFKEIRLTTVRRQEVQIKRTARKGKQETGKQVATPATAAQRESGLTQLADMGNVLNEERGRNTKKLFPGAKVPGVK